MVYLIQIIRWSEVIQVVLLHQMSREYSIYNTETNRSFMESIAENESSEINKVTPFLVELIPLHISILSHAS